MAFPYQGSTGLFTRLGGIGGLLNSTLAYLGTGNLSAAGLESLGSGIDKVQGQYASPDLNLTNGLYPARDAYRSVHNTYLSYLQSLAQQTLIQTVNDYIPLPTQTVSAALAAIITQMITDGQTVTKPTVSATPANLGTNIGGGVGVCTCVGEKGVSKDYVFNEVIQAVVTLDGQTSGGVAGQEVFTVTSPAAAVGVTPSTATLAWNYPLGSGQKGTITAVDAQVDASKGNFLQNGSWKQWSNPTIGPDNWLILAGAVGTQITQISGSAPYKGGSSLAFVGDGATLTSITQPFNVNPSTAGNAGGSPLTLSPLTTYALCVWLKVSAVPLAGVLAIDLTDGNNNVTNDYSGTPNSISIALTTATTSYVPYTVVFRTPALIPATGFRLRLNLTTALSSGTALSLSNMAMQAPGLLYAGGPRLGAFAGYPNFVNGDTINFTIANNYSSKWALAIDRLLQARSLGYQLPSSAASPTILDSLVS